MFCYIVLTISNDIVANREMTQTVLWLFIVLRILCDLFMILQTPLAAAIFEDHSFTIFWGLIMLTTIIGVFLNSVGSNSCSKVAGVYALNQFLSICVLIMLHYVLKTTTLGLVIIYWLNIIWMFRLYHQVSMIKATKELQNRNWKGKLTPLVITALFLMKILEKGQKSKRNKQKSSKFNEL